MKGQKRRIKFWEKILFPADVKVADLSKDQDLALRKLQNCEYRALRLEKINYWRAYHVFSVRIKGMEDSDRILFTTVSDPVSGARNALILSVVENHDYPKALRGLPKAIPDGVFTEWTPTAQDEKLVAKEVPEQESEENDGLSDAESDDGLPKFHDAVLYNGNILTLSPEQSEILGITGELKLQLPCILSGAPGSGKTMIASEFLMKHVSRIALFTAEELAAQQQPVEEFVLAESYYFAPTGGLITAMRKQIRASFPENDPRLNRVVTNTFEDYLRQLVPNLEIYGEKQFLEWRRNRNSAPSTTSSTGPSLRLKGRKNASATAANDNSSSASAAVSKSHHDPEPDNRSKALYRELCIAATCDNLEAYKALGARQSSAQEGARAGVWNLAVSYKDHLEQMRSEAVKLGQNLVDPNIENAAEVLKIPPRPKDENNLVVIDESQSFSGNVLKAIKAIFGANILFIGDANQSMLNSVSNEWFIKKLFFEDQRRVSDVHLPFSHRLPERVKTLSGKLLEVLHEKTSERRKVAPGVVGENVTKKANRGGCFLYQGESELDKFIAETSANKLPDSCVIIPDSVTVDARVEGVEMDARVEKAEIDERIAIGKKFGASFVLTPREALGLEHKNVILYNMMQKISRNFELVGEEVTDSEKLAMKELFVALTRTLYGVFICEKTAKLIPHTGFGDLLSELNADSRNEAAANQCLQQPVEPQKPLAQGFNVDDLLLPINPRGLSRRGNSPEDEQLLFENIKTQIRAGNIIAAKTSCALFCNSAVGSVGETAFNASQQQGTAANSTALPMTDEERERKAEELFVRLSAEVVEEGKKLEAASSQLQLQQNTQSSASGVTSKVTKKPKGKEIPKEPMQPPEENRGSSLAGAGSANLSGQIPPKDPSLVKGQGPSDVATSSTSTPTPPGTTAAIEDMMRSVQINTLVSDLFQIINDCEDPLSKEQQEARQKIQDDERLRLIKELEEEEKAAKYKKSGKKSEKNNPQPQSKGKGAKAEADKQQSQPEKPKEKKSKKETQKFLIDELCKFHPDIVMKALCKVCGSSPNKDLQARRTAHVAAVCEKGINLHQLIVTSSKSYPKLSPLSQRILKAKTEVERVEAEKAQRERNASSEAAAQNQQPTEVPSPTLVSLAEDGNEDACCFLLQRGANIEIRNKNGPTPLGAAAHKGHIAVIKLLLNSGADVEDVDNKGMTLLMQQAIVGNVEVCRILVQNGAKIEARNNDGLTPLMHSAGHGKTIVCEFFLENGAEIEAKDNDGLTPLMYAAKHGFIETCKLFLDKRANIRAENRPGITPIICAAACGEVGVIELFLENGVVVSGANKDGGMTPLIAAATSKKVQVCEVLLKNGAGDKVGDIEAALNAVRMPEVTATTIGNYDAVIKLLSDWKEKLNAKKQSSASSPPKTTAQLTSAASAVSKKPEGKNSPPGPPK